MQTVNTVRQWRKAKGYTQDELAELVDVSRRTIVQVELGNTAPSVTLALRIAYELDRTVDELFALDWDGCREIPERLTR